MASGDYRTARSVIWIVETAGWVVMGGAVVLGFLASQRMGFGPIIGMILTGMVSGLIIVVLAQMARAQVDTADSTAAMLVEMQRMRHAQEEALKAARFAAAPAQQPSSPPFVAPAPPVPGPDDDNSRYWKK